MPDQSFPQRKHPAHGVWVVSSHPTIVFLTVCTKDRLPWLATPEVHALLRSIWMGATAWFVGKYVIMPDHVHLFAAPGEVMGYGSAGASPSHPAGASPSHPAGASPSHVPLEHWVRFWKSQFTRRHRTPGHRWQAGHWDTRLRAWERYSDKWEYVRNNPVRHGLVDRAEDWPFQGEIYELSW